MAQQTGRDYQDHTIGRLMRSRQIATLYLCNRMSLRGRILRFDPYVVLLAPLDGSPPQMVYKSALVSVSGPPYVQQRRGGGRRPGSGQRRTRSDEHRSEQPRLPSEE